MTPKIKICGITNLADAREAARHGADFLGLNFYEQSPRYIAPPDAAEISSQIRREFPHAKIVGVFVNSEPSEINEIVQQVALDLIQLHGDEQKLLTLVRPVWRAVRMRDDAALDIPSLLLGTAGILVDAFSEHAYGGTGKTANWDIVATLRDQLPYLILAGGLTSANVAQAITKVHPDVVDTASGVEVDGNPRKKDWEKMQAFIKAVQKTNF